jgi:hypothetical protein
MNLYRKLPTSLNFGKAGSAILPDKLHNEDIRSIGHILLYIKVSAF